MPFAGYKDFAECVSKNSEKGDAKAYCATIMRKVEKPKEKLVFSSPIIAESKTEGDRKRMFIIGNAITAGFSRNKTMDGKKILYKEEELKRAAEKMVGIPLMLNHDSDDVRKIVGKVVEARFENGAVPYKAEIDIGETDIVRKLEGGFINRVSIGSDYERLEIKEDTVSPIGLDILELSMIPIAGIPTADISQVICEKYEVSNMADNTKELESQLAEMKTQIEKLTSEKASIAEKLKASEEAGKIAEAKTSEFSKLNDVIKELKEKVSAIERTPKGVVETGIKEKRLELKSESVGKMMETYSPTVKNADGNWLY